MKARNTLTAALILASGLSGTAQAALHDRGGGFIYDDALNVTWLQDANYAKTSGHDADGLMTWQDAMAWVADLSVYDAARDTTYDDWRLPVSDFCFNYAGCTDSEMGHLYYLDLGGVAYVELATTHNDNYYLFQNIQNPFDAAHWSSTVASTYPSLTVWAFDMDNGVQSKNGVIGPMGEQGYAYAWAIRDGDVAAVPEPEAYAMMLAGIGLVGFAAGRRKLSHRVAGAIGSCPRFSTSNGSYSCGCCL